MLLWYAARALDTLWVSSDLRQLRGPSALLFLAASGEAPAELFLLAFSNFATARRTLPSDWCAWGHHSGWAGRAGLVSAEWTPSDAASEMG